MNDREIIIGMVDEIVEEHIESGKRITPVFIADYLIANGVTIQKQGRWEEWWPGISLIMTGEEMLYRCSVCDAKYATVENKRYCPNCGARMDLEVDNAETN